MWIFKHALNVLENRHMLLTPNIYFYRYLFSEKVLPTIFMFRPTTQYTSRKHPVVIYAYSIAITTKPFIFLVGGSFVIIMTDQPLGLFRCFPILHFISFFFMVLGEIRPTSGEETRLTNEHISFVIPLKKRCGVERCIVG